jgi:patatin-like phospholipase/acyl hydrolase
MIKRDFRLKTDNVDIDHQSVKVLSLNGGGVKGLFTVTVLAEIERILTVKTQKEVKIGDYFDLITGTSIGGILALGLASGKSARELEKIFTEEAQSIFPKSFGFVSFFRLLFSHKYKSRPLQKVVTKMVGQETTFNDLTRRVVIPSVNLATGKPQFFKTQHNPDFTRDGRLKLIDAAMATSAAPTYFQPHYCKDLSSYFVDGGLVANDPSLIGYLEVFSDMKSDFPEVTPKNVRILNIGTLSDEYIISPKSIRSKWRSGYVGLWGKGERLVLTTMTVNQILHSNMLQRELMKNECPENYVNLDTPIPNEAANEITLDNASDSSLLTLSACGKQIATEEFTKNPHLKSFFNDLAKPFK